MEKKITAIYVVFAGIPPRKRKETQHVLRIGEIDGHIALSSEDMNEWERKAWRSIEDTGIRRTKPTALLRAHHSREEDGMVFTPLFPQQQQIILRNL